MAFLQVQTSAQATGTGATVVATVTATGVNNLAVVHINVNSPTETCTGVTDDQGNTYALSSGQLYNSDNRRLYMAYGVQVVGGVTSITASFSAAVAGKVVGVDEFSGGKTTNAAVFDKTSQQNGSGTSLSVPSFNPIATGELICAVASVNGTLTYTAGANYTMYNGVNPAQMRSEYRLSSAASETAPMTVDTDSFGYGEVAMAFIPIVNDPSFRVNNLRPRAFAPGHAR